MMFGCDVRGAEEFVLVLCRHFAESWRDLKDATMMSALRASAPLMKGPFSATRSSNLIWLKHHTAQIYRYQVLQVKEVKPDCLKALL